MRNKLYVWLLCLPLLVVGCHPDKGKPVIGEDEMADILYEYYQEQAIISVGSLPDKNDRNDYYCQLLKKYGYTEAEFDSALVWYTQNLDVWEQVYIRVYDRMSVKIDSLKRTLNTPTQEHVAGPDTAKTDSAAVLNPDTLSQ